MRTFRLYIFLILFFSCEKKETFYEYLVIQNSDIKLWNIPFPDNWKNNIENGDWFIKTPKNDTIVQGKFVDGLRHGTWEYHASDTQKIEINWDDYENKVLKMNYPSDWKVYEANGRPFQAGLPSPENSDDKYFIILSYDRDTVNMNLNEYWQLYNTKTFEKDSVKSYIQYKFEQDKNIFYYSEYTIVRKGEESLVFNFLGELNSKIYDITFSSLNIQDTKKRIIFFEMVRSLVIERHRFFSPYLKVDKIEELRFILPKSPQV